MVDRPLLFSAPMVRAIREGRKTQTRRALKPIPYNREGDAVNINLASAARYMQGADGGFYYQFDHPKGGPLTAHRARFVIGDRLWIKETWQAGMSDNGPCVAYRADGDRYYPEFTGPSEGAGPTFDYDAHPAKAWRHGYWIADVESRGPWSTPLHMPRWASRLTLTVTDVRVERLQDISRADAIAEGLTLASNVLEEFWRWPEPHHENLWLSPPAAYRHLWNAINGAGAWEANPWVVAVTFSVREGNIDG